MLAILSPGSRNNFLAVLPASLTRSWRHFSLCFLPGPRTNAVCARCLFWQHPTSEIDFCSGKKINCSKTKYIITTDFLSCVMILWIDCDQFPGVLINWGIQGNSFISIGSSWWEKSARENLHVISPCDLGSSQHGGWLPRRGITGTNILREPDKTPSLLIWLSFKCHPVSLPPILLIKSKSQGQCLIQWGDYSEA